MTYLLLLIIALLLALLGLVFVFLRRWREQSDQAEDLMRLIIQELEALKFRGRR